LGGTKDYNSLVKKVWRKGMGWGRRLERLGKTSPKAIVGSSGVSLKQNQEKRTQLTGD